VSGCVRLPLNNPEYWEKIKTIESNLLCSPRTTPVGILGYLDEYDLSPLGMHIHIEAHLLTVLNIFLLQQYQLKREQRVIQVEPSDIVIDGGGCWGDTALYFANKAGENGLVFSFEFEPENLKMFRKNLNMNPGLSNRIRIIPFALWSKTGEVLSYKDYGPGSYISDADSLTDSVATETIDELVTRENIIRIDFIKMDIKGAELDALKGAEKTIKTFQPKLAISLYHKLEHLWEIPHFINDLGLGYEFYIDHFTIHSEETMLFASLQQTE
jgi:FkbM family methyltransferase